MRIISSKTVISGKNEAGEPYILNLQLPIFPDEDEISEKLNKYYSDFMSVLKDNAEKFSLVTVSELRVTCNSGDAASFYIDIANYKDGNLLKYIRVSDNRDENGNEIPFPKHIEKMMRVNDGFYRDADNYYVFKNVFEPGGEKGTRRSDFGKTFVNSVKIPVQTSNKAE